MSRAPKHGWIREISASVVRHPEFVMAVVSSRSRDEVEAVLSRLLKEALAQHRPGEQVRIYAPQSGAAERVIQRHQWLRDNWTGSNLDELARTTGMSKRQIRRVVGNEPHWRKNVDKKLA